MTVHGFQIYSLVYLVNGYNIFGSSFFTALNNGILSAVISFLRTLVFQIGAIIVLPFLLGIDGVWTSILVAEIMTLMITAYLFIKKRDYYHY